jgi:pimeloyl-ACP methyl ester carboxylesterase
MRTLGMLLAVIWLIAGVGPAPAAAQGPIKIGFLSPMSGAIAQAGKDMYSGCELYWQERGMQIAGRKLEVILEDTEGQPATAVSKLRKLIDSDRVNLLAGVILSNVAYALVPPIEAAGIPTIYPINSADDLATACRALADLDLRPALGAIRNPTRVVVGALDATTPPALARELAAGIAGATFVEIPDCAHCPPIENPAALLAAVEPFLAPAAAG